MPTELSTSKNAIQQHFFILLQLSYLPENMITPHFQSSISRKILTKNMFTFVHYYKETHHFSDDDGIVKNSHLIFR